MSSLLGVFLQAYSKRIKSVFPVGYTVLRNEFCLTLAYKVQYFPACILVFKCSLDFLVYFISA